MIDLTLQSEIEVAFSISTGRDVSGTGELFEKEKTPKGRTA